jgi:hypothetical protein
MQTYDKNRPEDVDTTGEDHLCDSLRYLLMSRYYRPEMVKKKEKRDAWSDIDDKEDGVSWKAL